MNIIVNGDYYGRTRHGLGDFHTGLAEKVCCGRATTNPATGYTTDTELSSLRSLLKKLSTPQTLESELKEERSCSLYVGTQTYH